MSTYRPREVEVESDGVVESFQFGVFEVYGVITQHGRDHVSESARRSSVDFRLIVFQAYPKPGPARCTTRTSPFSTTALTDTVFAVFVNERF